MDRVSIQVRASFCVSVSARVRVRVRLELGLRSGLELGFKV
jgi:hypothetical protein